MSDNPFTEPPDDDRTVIRPAPGGRRPAPPPPAAAPLPLPPSDPSAPPAISVSPLTVAASPLLQLLARLSSMHRGPDPRALRDRVARDLRNFELQAREAGIAMDLLRPAHYALCASFDDVVLNTPWGAASDWGRQTLVAAFHAGAQGTDQFFDQLRQMRKASDKFLPVIELMYFCLSFGFMGRTRQTRGGGELEQVRSETHAAIATQRKAIEPELSRHWRGVIAPYQPGRHGLPAWVTLAGAVALCGGLLFWTSTGLNAASDGVQAQVLATPPTHMPQITRAAVVQPLPPPPAPPEPTALDRLRAALQSEIDKGDISLIGTSATPIIRVSDHLMFASGSAVVQSAALPLLERIASALRNESGALRVIDYTDNQPVRSVRYPSNFQLSSARANSVRAIVARTVGDPTRVSAEGRADADPIAPNTTAQGREQNQRIEFVLNRQD